MIPLLFSSIALNKLTLPPSEENFTERKQLSLLETDPSEI
jgi:hypothetical protein